MIPKTIQLINKSRYGIQCGVLEREEGGESLATVGLPIASHGDQRPTKHEDWIRLDDLP